MMGTIRPVLSKQDFRITLQRKLLIINVQCNADLHNIMFTQYLLHTHYLVIQTAADMIARSLKGL